MKLVIDAGILFTALSGKGITKSLILRELFLRKLSTLVRETTRIEDSRAFKNSVFDEARTILEVLKTSGIPQKNS